MKFKALTTCFAGGGTGHYTQQGRLSPDEKNTEKVIRYLLDCKETVIVIAHNLSEEIEQEFDEIIRT